MKKKKRKAKGEDPALGVVLGALIADLGRNRDEVERSDAQERKEATDGTAFFRDWNRIYGPRI